LQQAAREVEEEKKKEGRGMSVDGAKSWSGAPPTAASKPKKVFMPRLVRSNRPDHVIGASALLQGRLEFTGLMRVEGRFEGVLKPGEGGSLMVARSGVIVGDVEGCYSVVVEGTVVGNISATVVDLRRNAYIVGNVWCKDLAATSTAVFRNRGVVTSMPGSSVPPSSLHHRRSSSAALDLGGRGLEGENNTSSTSLSRRAAGIGTRNVSSSGSSSGSCKANANGSSNASPDSSNHYCATVVSAAPSASSSGSFGRAAAAAAAAAKAAAAVVSAVVPTTAADNNGLISDGY
ncbi:unnamed protein product, partial [Pylaiella littoralis]